MTDKQKNAISVLNELLQEKHIDEEKYFMLLDFVVGERQYVPIQVDTPYVPSFPYPWTTYNTTCEMCKTK